MSDVAIPPGGIVALVEPNGVITASSDGSVAADAVISEVWPGAQLDVAETQSLDGDATLVVRSADAGSIVEVEACVDDELQVLRWLDEQRTRLRDAETAAAAADGVAAAVGRFLGLDAVEVRSFDVSDQRWDASGSVSGPTPTNDDEVALRWSQFEHLVADVEQAPSISGQELERSAIARPSPGALRAGVAAIVSVPLRDGGSHRGELVGWAGAPIAPRGPLVRRALGELAADLAARCGRELRTHHDDRDVLDAIGHDLRSPLRAVANYAELLAVPHGPVDDELVAFTSRMHTAARQANEQLDGLVEFLDAEAPDDVDEVDLDRAFDQIAASWTTSLSVVTIERTARLLRPVARPSLIQALAILVENSVAVRRVAAPITLTVSTEAMVAGGCRIVLVDDGPGILRQISAFRWSDGTRSQATVGPALARRIVEVNGGRLLVDAVRDVATTWTVELPAR